MNMKTTFAQVAEGVRTTTSSTTKTARDDHRRAAGFVTEH